MHAVIFFTQYPLEGDSRTALGKHIGMEQAASLSKCLLKDFFHTHAQQDYDVYFSTREKKDHERLNRLLGANVAFYLQNGDTSLERVHNCLRDMLRQYDSVFILFTDVPALTPSQVYDLFSILELNDVVLAGRKMLTMLGVNKLIAVDSLETALFQKAAESNELTCAVLDPLLVVEAVTDLFALKKLERAIAPHTSDFLHAQLFDLSGELKQ